MKFFQNISHNFWKKDYSDTLRLYRKVLYLVLLADLLLQIPILSYTLAPSSLTPINNNTVLGLWAPVLNILNLPLFSSFYIYFSVIYGVLLVLGFLRIQENIVAFLVFLGFKIICFKTIELNNGGHDLMGLLLFYNIFYNYATHQALRSISNTALFFARLQICGMYFFAGINKLDGSTWLDGSAMTLVLQNDFYSNLYLRDFLLSMPLVMTISTYLVLLYQLLFSGLVWIPFLKKYVLTAGLLFHLSIWIITGLYDFAWFAMVSYVLFLDPTTSLFLNKNRKIFILGRES